MQAILLSIRVAADTISQIFQRNIFLDVFLLDRPRLMLMAPITGVGSVGFQMAGRAGHFTRFAMIQRKVMYLKPGWNPCLSRMTILAADSKYTGVNFRLGMALHTFSGGAMKNTGDMAAGTLDLAMHPIQRKNLSVIKTHHPIHPIMAIQAGIAKLLDMAAHKLSPGIVAGGMADGARLGIETG
jgi:hypothetical protein